MAIPAVELIIQRYPDVFKDELGELRNYTASLRVDSNIKPIIYKARHAPYALREKVNKELDRRESGDNRTYTVFRMGSPYRCSS